MRLLGECERECASAARCATCARAPRSSLSVLRSPARSLEHVITAAGQPSVQSVAHSSNPYATALPGLVGAAVGAADASPSSIADHLLP
jgi:hypothetical protein